MTTHWSEKGVKYTYHFLQMLILTCVMKYLIEKGVKSVCTILTFQYAYEKTLSIYTTTWQVDLFPSIYTFSERNTSVCNCKTAQHSLTLYSLNVHFQPVWNLSPFYFKASICTYFVTNYVTMLQDDTLNVWSKRWRYFILCALESLLGDHF
jgi:hypothetical protein